MVLSARYGEEGGRLCFVEGVGSVWWRSLNNIREGVGLVDGGWWFDNIDRKIRDVASTLFWKVPWVDSISLKIRFTRLFGSVENKLTSVTEMNELG